MKNYLFFLLLSSLFIFSCNENALEDGHPDYSYSDNSSIALENRTNTPPTNRNGILAFSDSTHLSDYYLYLISIAENTDDIDSSLELIENTLNFTSLRSLKELVEFSDFSEIDTSESNFIGDPVLKSILNNYHELIVDDKTVVFQNKSEIYEVLSSNTLVLQNLRNTPKGQRLPLSGFTSDINLISDDRQVITTRTNPPDEDCDPEAELFNIGNCSSFNGKLTTDCSYNLYENEYYDLEIDWGDGNTESFSNLFGSVDKFHVYQNGGNYTVQVTISSTCLTSDWENEMTIDFGCNGASKKSTYWKTWQDKIALVAETWTISYKYLPWTWAGAQSYYFRKVGDKWKKKRASELAVYIESKFREQSICLKISEDDDTDKCKNCKSITRRVSGSKDYRFHITGDVLGAHALRYSSVYLNGSKALDFCN